jgi:hypothetical protein
LLTLSFASSALAAEPVIANRAPRSDEWGYRPADDAAVRLNPPSLTWVHELEAETYVVQWAREREFRDAQTARGVPWPTYTHHEPLARGEYYWRYRLETKKGVSSNWSVARRFTVPAEAVPFPMPTRAQQRQRVPQGHPRLFLRPEDLPRVRAAAQAGAARALAELRAEADRALAAGPTPEPQHLGSARDKDNEELLKYWWPNREQAMKACQEAETIALVYLVTGERKYQEAARRWILHLASWDPDGPTNFRLNCEAGKPMLYRPARAYDWAYDALTESDRDKVRRAMLRRVRDAWESGEVQRGVGHLNRPYSSHGNRTWHKVGEAGIAFLGEIPEADQWLDYAVNKFYACYPVWSDDDGGWHEGVSYWGGYLSKAVWWLQVSQSALGIDGLRKPFFAQVGDFPLYVAPPGSPNMGFGDLSHRPPSTGFGGLLEYFLRAGGNRPEGSHAGYWRWWTEQWRMRGERGVLGFLYQVNLPPLPPARPPADLPPSKVFHGIGVASLHTTLLDSRDDVHFLFKSSPMGSQSHGHNPQNSFQLNAFGQSLLTTCVYRDLHGSRFHYGWAHSTVAHNAVLVDGEGQKKHTPAPQGRILAEKLTAKYDYLVGDALPAYEGRLVRAKRHVAFVKGIPTPVIVLYDDLESPKPSAFQFMLHALAEFQVDENEAVLSVELPQAGIAVKYLSPVPLAFRQWDGFEPKPTRSFPNQWHVEASTRSKQPRVEMLTLLVPHRKDRPVKWTARRIDSRDAVGLQAAIGDVPVAVAFRREGASGEASWDGRSFAGPVLVQP